MNGCICAHYGQDERDGRDEGFLSDYKMENYQMRYWSLDGKYMIGNVSLRETSEIASIDYYDEASREEAIKKAQEALDDVF